MPRPSRTHDAVALVALPLVLAALAGALSGCGGSKSSGGGALPGGGGGACALPAATSLSVVSITPASGATNVLVSTDVTVRFNTCVDTTSFGPTSVMLMGGAGFVQTTLAYDGATATLTIHPSGPLAYGTTYLLSLMGLRGAQGQTMATAFSSSFKTQLTPDTTPPTTTASPVGGSYRTAQSVTLTCTDNAGGTGCAGTHYTVDGSAPTLTSPLYAAPISITANTVLSFFSVDVAGNAETPKQESYVIDTIPPTLVSNVPSNGATAVPLTQVLTATFSEAMAPATLGPSTVTADNGLTFGFAWNATTFTLTLTPTERLVCGKTYHVSIGAGATDLAGNPLVQPATFSFGTSADCVEPVTTASVASGVYRATQSVTLSCTDDVGGSGCYRIVYTTDGTMPSLYPVNGTVVVGATAGPVSIGVGDTTLRWFAEDNAGNREALKQAPYAVSTSGFTFVAMNDGIARGVGPTPTSFVPLLPGGLTNVFVRDPSNGRLYRGTGNGLLVAEPGSEAFTLLPASPGSVLSVLPQGSKLFVGTGAGLFVSTDGGATFAQRTLGTIAPGTYGAPAWVKAIVAQGANVWAATDGGVAYSTDLGESFAMRTTASGLGSNAVNGLVLGGTTLYAATGNGLSRSTDGGVTFSNVTAGLGSPSVNALVVSGSTVYAGTSNGLSVSSDGGATFPTTFTSANGLGSNYVDAIAFDGTYLYAVTGDPVVSGTTNTFAVSNAALTAFTPHQLTPSNPTLRGGTVQVEGTTPRTVRVGAYPNYYLSTDGGLTFASMDLRGTAYRVVSVPTATAAGATIYAALSDSSGYGGIAVSTDLGQSFIVRNQDNGLPDNNASDVAASGSNVYAATFPGLGISTNGGTSFTKSAAIAAGVDSVWAGGATVWAGDSSGNLLRSTNSGTSFTTQKATTGAVLFAIVASGTNVYAAGSNGLWVSNDSGTTFGAATGLTYVNDVAVDGVGNVLATNNGTLYVAPSPGTAFALPSTSPGTTGGVHAQGSVWYAALGLNGVAISQDAGATWTTVPVGPASAWLSARDVWYVP